MSNCRLGQARPTQLWWWIFRWYQAWIYTAGTASCRIVVPASRVVHVNIGSTHRALTIHVEVVAGVSPRSLYRSVRRREHHVSVSFGLPTSKSLCLDTTLLVFKAESCHVWEGGLHLKPGYLPVTALSWHVCIIYFVHYVLKVIERPGFCHSGRVFALPVHLLSQWNKWLLVFTQNFVHFLQVYLREPLNYCIEKVVSQFLHLANLHIFTKFIKMRAVLLL